MAENYVMQQRRKLTEAIADVIRLDPDYTEYHAVVKGFILIVDLSGFTPNDDESVIEEVRGQPWADIAMFSADATGETDLPEHSGEGLLRYVAAHYEEIYQAMAPSEEENNGE